MGCVYRYTDLSDNIIKYIGIVWSENRTLKKRVEEHLSDVWCIGKEWKIEYIEENICTRTDAEYFESHYISLYRTDRWYNSTKINWGVSNYLPNREDDWKIYDILRHNNKSLNQNPYNKNSLLKYKDDIIRVLETDINAILVINCVNNSMPRWIDISNVEKYRECTEQEMRNVTGRTVQKYDSLNQEEREFVHEHFTLIAGVIPFIGDERQRCYMISKISKENNVSKQTIRNYLKLYLVYQDISVLSPKLKENKPLSKDEKNMEWALNKYVYTEYKNSLNFAYTMMLKEKYTDNSGMLSEKYPSIHQFRYFNKRYNKQ